MFCFLDEDVLNEEELDKELLWNLQLLSEVWKPDVYKTKTNMTSKVRMKSVYFLLSPR